jgi:predicted aldo/keto reductase-like oxidoreductase
MRYNLLGQGDHWFPGAQAKSLDQINLDAIARRTGLGDRLKQLLRQAHEQLGEAPVKRLSAAGT